VPAVQPLVRMLADARGSDIDVVPADQLARQVERVKVTLATQPGWSDGNGVTFDALSNLIEEWDDEHDDDFQAAVEKLEEGGWLRVEYGDDEDEEEHDILYSAVQPVKVTAAPPQSTQAETAPASSSLASPSRSDSEEAAVIAAPPQSTPAKTAPASSSLASPNMSESEEAAERVAVTSLREVLASLRRFGLDKADVERREKLNKACRTLLQYLPSGQPPLAEDPRFLGDWQLVGTSLPEFAQRQGITGLGSAPFTEPAGLFYRFDADGSVLAKEVLELFGKPILLNELRGKFLFDDSGEWLQEQYSSADLAGVADNPEFTSAKFTTQGNGFTSSGDLRIHATSSGFNVYRRMPDGQLESWLQERDLPWVGGTTATLDSESLARAYPYLKDKNKPDWRMPWR